MKTMTKSIKDIGIMKWIVGAVLVVVLAFFGFTAEVREGEYAVITRFGAVRAEVTDAGLYAKLPWPFESVTKYDVRNQYTESSYLETLTQDKRNIILQSFAVWHVSEPLKYHTSVGSNTVAEQYINDLIINASNGIMGNYQLSNVVSSDTEKLKLAEIEGSIFESVKSHALSQYGIEVTQVNIMRLSLPEENLNSVFEQMSADRQKYIDQITAEGTRDANKVTAAADAEASRITAEGIERAAEIEAETAALVAEIYKNAQEANWDLYYFLTQLDSVLNSVGSDTTMIVKKDEYLYGLFPQDILDMVAEAQKANAAAGGTTPGGGTEGGSGSGTEGGSGSGTEG